MADRGSAQRKDVPASLQQGGAVAQQALKDASSKKLEALAKGVGNDEIQQRLNSQSAKRDELLQFLVQRLETLRDVQQRELALSQKAANFDWWRQVGDAQKDVGKPDPTRWRESAHQYEQASYHLCRGDVRRGQAELKKAMDAEKRAFDQLTKLVEVSEQERGQAAPEALGDAGVGAAGACAEPEGVQVAREIQNVTTTPNAPPVVQRVQDPWWTEEEEEEEQADGKPA
jgi:hypothetical protein